MRETTIDESEFRRAALKNPELLRFGFVIALQIAAFWTTWRWLGLRVWTSAEERWSFAALAAAIFFAFFWTKPESATGERTANAPASVFSIGSAFSIFLTFLYAASFGSASPPLPRAILAMTALTFTLSSRRFGKTFHVGLWSLLLLSLPTAASLQFFLGYPLRVAVGAATAALLRLQGLDVWREGVCLHFGEKIVWIDAPCSGVKMLWFGLFLAAFLVCFHRLSNLKAAAAIVSAVFIILLGNVFRASALFYIESETIEAPPFMHEATGVFAFILTVLGIAAAVRFWRTTGKEPTFQNPIRIKVRIDSRAVGIREIFPVLFLLACATAFTASFWLPNKKTGESVKQNFKGFPDTFKGGKVRQLPLSERESYFLEDFPGNVGRFSDGKREIIVRYVREATRKLHPANDCFRAIGYSTKPLPLKIDNDGKRWSCFSAVKANEKLRVCERIYDDAGNEWTDVSAWYWTVLGAPDGGWWAVTTAERDFE